MTRLVVVLLLATLSLVPSAVGSRATFPGRDGKLVFQSNRDGGFEIYEAAADGSNPRKLLSRPDTDEFNASWSPDGRSIVFQSGPPDGSNFDIWVMNADGSGARVLVTGSTNDRAAQFCDRDTAVFTRELTATNSEILAVETNGEGVRQLTARGGTNSFPTCSPDGSRIAFISTRGGQPTVYEMGASGDSPPPAPVTATPSLDPDYGPDGTSIAYVAPDGDGNLEVFTKGLGPGGGVVQRTFSNSPIEYRLPKFDPSSKGAAGELTATRRNRTTGAETVVRVFGDSGESPDAVADPGSAGVLQPLVGGAPALVGTAGGDVIRGTPQRDVISGRGGDDRLFGGGGNDRVAGGDGNDSVFGDGGDDSLFGGGGNDRVAGGDGNDSVFGDGGDDSLFGDRGNDRVSGGPGSDRITGGSGRDRLQGGSGRDRIFARDRARRQLRTRARPSRGGPRRRRRPRLRVRPASLRRRLQIETGATGLEPATSGVTGRYEANRHSRLRPGIIGWSRPFFAERTGCHRLRAAAARHNRVVCV